MTALMTALMTADSVTGNDPVSRLFRTGVPLSVPDVGRPGRELGIALSEVIRDHGNAEGVEGGGECAGFMGREFRSTIQPANRGENCCSL